jgi:hypothetical protein
MRGVVRFSLVTNAKAFARRSRSTGDFLGRLAHRRVFDAWSGPAPELDAARDGDCHPQHRRFSVAGRALKRGEPRSARQCRRATDRICLAPDRHFLSSACSHDQALADQPRKADPSGHNFNCAAGVVGLFRTRSTAPTRQSPSHGSIEVVFRQVP